LPIIVKCSGCGYILYKDAPKSFIFELRKWKNTTAGGSGLWLHQLIYKHENKCPKCHKKLQLPPKLIEIIDPETGYVEKVKIK